MESPEVPNHRHMLGKKITLHWTSLTRCIFVTKVHVQLMWFYFTLMRLNVRVKMDKRMTLTFLPGPDLILSSNHSIFGHTNKKRSIKTTKLHFFHRESYLINQRLREERINVCSRWGENHLRKQWKRHWRLTKSATLSETKQATCHFSTIECSWKKANQESYSAAPHHWVSGVSSLAP